jgi:hypothetical protein
MIRPLDGTYFNETQLKLASTFIQYRPYIIYFQCQISVIFVFLWNKIMEYLDMKANNVCLYYHLVMCFHNTPFVGRLGSLGSLGRQGQSLRLGLGNPIDFN